MERMVNNPTIKKSESLGSYLYSQRVERQLEVEDIQNETRIPSRILRAMEADDFASLPAEAFARGFYALYAKSLELDVDQILEWYTQERGVPQKNMYAELSSAKDEKPVNKLAARPMVSPGSLLGFAMVLAIVSLTAICWYFSWNPATFISDFLRSFQETPAFEQTDEIDSPTEENTSEQQKNLSSTTNHFKEQGAPLVVMSGEKIKYYTRNGIVFLTVPPSGTSKN